MFGYPSVLTTVGKKLVTLADDTFARSMIVSTQVLISSNASFRPWKKVCDSAETQSSSPTSSWSL